MLIAPTQSATPMPRQINRRIYFHTIIAASKTPVHRRNAGKVAVDNLSTRQQKVSESPDNGLTGLSEVTLRAGPKRRLGRGHRGLC